MSLFRILFVSTASQILPIRVEWVYNNMLNRICSQIKNVPDSMQSGMSLEEA